MKFRGREIRALLLDLDDTLLDNQAGLGAAQAAAAEVLALRTGLTEPEILAHFAASAAWFWGDDERHRWGRLDMRGARRALIAHLLETLGRPDTALADDVSHLYSDLREEGLVPIEGALECLDRLKIHFDGFGLITNGAAAAQRAKIDRFDLAAHFDVIVVEGEFGAGKPDASVFGHALDTIAMPAEAALMVGDNFECDVLGALGAGLEAVWITREGRPPPVEAPRPFGSVPSFAVIERLLEE